ncbi:DUF4400 domain-containing protein [Cupriavidus sp. YAF13]|uniref:DUF4400 domain-containing protein n=1 Tax=Cupriavidus sp. YAF13 TaxID=3233075 RepID=UPI003F93441D
MSSRYEFHELKLIHVFVWPLKLLWKILYIYGVLCAICVTTFLLAAHYLWASPVENAYQIYRHSMEATTLLGAPSRATWLVQQSADFAYWLFFQVTQLHDILSRLTHNIANSGTDATIGERLLRPWLKELWIAALAVKTFGSRLMLLLTGWPVLLLAFWCGMTDGLVERSIRSASAGRESSGLYHRSKYAQLSLGATSVLVFVCLPYQLDVRWVLFPIALTIGILARTQWKFFKKYL